jgi:hypothetical protein
MTNKTDNYNARVEKLKIGVEETEGVTADGFVDPSGAFPTREHYYSTSVNKAAKGEKVNNLSMGGGDYDVSLNIPDQKPSLFPHNQVQETQSGHSFEMDDTPGGERVLIKHRTGAGVELRADGTVVISSRNQRVEVTGGDHTTIVEGEGKLIYKGNLTLDVSGDLNMNVGGNYNLNVAGDKKEDIKGRHTKTVNLDQNYTIRGTRGTKVIGNNTETLLGDHYQVVSGNNTSLTQGSVELLAGQDLTTTAVGEWVVASSTASLAARHISMFGHKGTIGGPLVDYYGKTYGGFPAAVTNMSTFYGTLVGKATESLHADYAMYAATAGFANGAIRAQTAVTAKDSKPGKPPTPVVPKPGIMPYTPIPATAPIPNPAVVELQLSSSTYGIRNVAVDPKLEQKLSRSDEYKGLFNHDPSIHEIRSKLRDPANLNNNEFTSYLVAEGKLNKNFKKNLHPKIGRSEGKKGTLRFGSNILGNNPTDNRSKRFKVNTK